MAHCGTAGRATVGDAGIIERAHIPPGIEMDPKVLQQIATIWKACVPKVTRAHVLGREDEAFQVWSEAMHEIFKASGHCRCDDECWLVLSKDDQMNALKDRQYSFQRLIEAIDRTDALLAPTRTKQ